MDHRAALVAAALGLGASGLQAMGLDEAVQSARADAAQHWGIAAESIVVVNAEAVTWPDSSLGCPKPGIDYMQALVPGYRIRLRANDAVLDYHASAGRRPVLCPAGQAVRPLPDRRS